MIFSQKPWIDLEYFLKIELPVRMYHTQTENCQSECITHRLRIASQNLSHTDWELDKKILFMSVKILQKWKFSMFTILRLILNMHRRRSEGGLWVRPPPSGFKCSNGQNYALRPSWKLVWNITRIRKRKKGIKQKVLNIDSMQKYFNMSVSCLQIFHMVESQFYF